MKATHMTNQRRWCKAILVSFSIALTLKTELSSVPADLLTRLTEGIEPGDVETIGDIRRSNASLADSLAQLAYQFEYGKLLSLIQEPI
jgi:hypothetical protein